MLRPSRNRRATRWLAWRIRLFGVAAILAVFGIASDVELLRWAALGVLVVVGALSVMGAREKDPTEDSEPRD